MQEKGQASDVRYSKIGQAGTIGKKGLVEKVRQRRAGGKHEIRKGRRVG
jgi:hypothetical protein